MEFTIHTIETAPEASKQPLVHAQETFGFIPNLEGILAESPTALQSGMALWDLFEASSFSTIEQQVIYLTANYENGCSYCVAAHSGLAKMIGMPAEHIEALRIGQPLSDQKLQALRLFTQRMIEARGWLQEQEISDFLAAGYTKQQILEVIVGIAVKTIHNYTNHIAETPLDKEFQAHKWSKP
ncbi:hypothetical protein C1752_02014 [Acaryochloris thomasi RCC1774]|uniref:Carboxymuconolactone decarboxylase-like domain-containing protein n=1 Tax=Acaryochloris thomasi RCC1774 TaxID=1764569 RepID=A0A2W1JJK6_9CYAN|nr:carboxymuconolactone decarboxylase family protein [Acaryochloris thomasi]PZD73589.1 hypothetical protein C1752_02014 [Acaryochloris thomasi RCC1774]